MTDKEEMIQCHFPDEKSLYMSFMTFVKNGGLFMHTKNEHELGELVTLSIRFTEDVEPHIVEGMVVWITPKGAQGNKPAGIGVQFISENHRQICAIIETKLAGMVQSMQSTDTM